MFNFTLITAATPLAKRYTRSSDGSVVVDSIAQMYEGEAEVATAWTLEDFAERLGGLQSNQAVIMGRFPEDAVELTTRSGEFFNPTAYARTNENTAWFSGAAAFVIDVDGIDSARETLGTVLDKLEAAHPYLRDVPRFARPSSSSYVDGRALRGVHVWLILAHGEQAPDLAKRLEVEQWNAGHGYYKISKNGMLLKRQLGDSLVYQPSRLMFEAAPILEDVPRQIPEGCHLLMRQPNKDGSRPAWVAGGGHLDVAKLPKLRAQDEKNALLRQAAARQSRQKEAVQTAVAYLAANGIIQESAALALDTIFRGAPLAHDWPLFFDDGDELTVGELLENPERFEGASMACPFDHKRRKGKAELVNRHGQWSIWSHRAACYIDLAPEAPEYMSPIEASAHLLAGTINFIEAPSKSKTPDVTVLQVLEALLRHADMMPSTDELTGETHDNPQGLPFDTMATLKALSVLGLRGVTHNQLNTAKLALQDRNLVNPTRDKVLALKWDGVPRLDTFFHDHMGSDDSPEVTAVTQSYLAAVVMRIINAGANAPFMPVFWGEQGVGKSRFIGEIARALGLADAACVSWGDDKAMRITCRRGVVVELAEMAGFGKKEAEAVKAFISENTDTYREVYKRTNSIFPRSYTLAGTSNRNEINRDDTGNRRMFAIEFRHKCEAPLELLVPQLLAEARERFCRNLPEYNRQINHTVDLIQAFNAAAMVRGEGVVATPLDDIVPAILKGATEVQVGHLLRAVVSFHIAYRNTTRAQIVSYLRMRGWRGRGVYSGQPLPFDASGLLQ